MSSLFSLPLPTYQQPLNKSSSRSLRSKKRKRKSVANRDEDSQDVADDDLEYLQDHQTAASSQSLEYSAVLTPEERKQYRAAGQPFDQEPPPFPFPHAPSRSDKLDVPQTDYPAKPPARTPTLHLQHLSVMTAILHRSLVGKDYTRASRAFGLILRDSIGGHAIDVRSEGRWGIGAEILLKAGSEHDRSLGKDERNDQTPQQTFLFTREGFERAKRYYERLMIQYPFSKPHAASMNALDFYQALFGLWIYIVHEEGKTEPDSDHGSAQLRELDQAREIAGRMDACMSSIPFSDDLELIRLRGMVALWLADLAESCSGGKDPSGDAMSVPTSPVNDITSDIGQIALQDLPKRDSRGALSLEGAQSRRVAQQMFSRLPIDGG
jgi:hypothetical protein